MKTARPIKGYTPGTLADPAFRYRPSAATDVAATFARARRAQAQARATHQQPGLFTTQRAQVPA